MYNVYVGSSELRFLDAKNWRENSKKIYFKMGGLGTDVVRRLSGGGGGTAAASIEPLKLHKMQFLMGCLLLLLGLDFQSE